MESQAFRIILLEGRIFGMDIWGREIRKIGNLHRFLSIFNVLS